MRHRESRRASPARERLVEAASRLFYGEGINAVGVERIIEEAGVARMTFYRHFPSKNDLIETVFEERAARFSTWLIARSRARSDDPYERLLAVFDLIECPMAAPDFHGCVVLRFAHEVGEASPRITEIGREQKDTVRRFLEEHARAAGLEQPGELSHALMLLMNGALSLGHLYGSVEPAKQAKKAARTLIGHAARELAEGARA